MALSAFSLFGVLSGINKGPSIGQTKYYNENSIFNQNLTTSGSIMTCGSSLTLGESVICGDTYLTPNLLDKKPKLPNLFVSGNIFGYKNLLISNISTFNNTIIANRNIVVNGKIILAGCGDVAMRINRADALPQSSDERLKENICTLDNSLQKVLSLRGVSFELKKNNKKLIGLIAQEVEKIIPEVVEETHEGYKGVHYSNLIGLLIEAIKEQQKQIDELREKIR